MSRSVQSIFPYAAGMRWWAGTYVSPSAGTVDDILVPAFTHEDAEAVLRESFPVSRIKGPAGSREAARERLRRRGML